MENKTSESVYIKALINEHLLSMTGTYILDAFLLIQRVLLKQLKNNSHRLLHPEAVEFNHTLISIRSALSNTGQNKIQHLQNNYLADPITVSKHPNTGGGYSWCCGPLTSSSTCVYKCTWHVTITRAGHSRRTECLL